MDCPSTERASAKGILLQRSEVIGCKRELAGVFRALESDRAQARIRSSSPDPDAWPYLTRDGQGRIACTIENFSWILQTDEAFRHLKYDALADAPVLEIETEGGQTTTRPWTDVDDAHAMEHIEATYKLYDRQKYRDAFKQRMRDVAFHPVKDAIEAIEWDGEARIEKFLFDWMGAEDTPYTREASRLIFAGGIHRLYEPGCKFDVMPVLIGTRQGEGKSTIVRWLALEDRWYGEVTVFEGKEAAEQLQGVWICEASEMLAFTRARDQELVKSFLSRQCDRYRPPYAERVREYPRKVIVIGTTNNRNFLRDKTGNRRYLPVEVHMDAAQLYYLEKACKAYIRQCWAEALSLYRAGKLSPVPDLYLRKEIRAAQDAAMEDDWRVGAIEAYVEKASEGHFFCVREVARNALALGDEKPRDPNTKECREITQILDHLPSLERAGRKRLPYFGQQRVWKRRTDVTV